MKNMKKTLLISLSLVLIAALAVGLTLAYLTDSDGDVNVMTMGNVSIEQIEQERNTDGKLVDFTQNKPALPAVGNATWADTGVTVNGTEYKVFSADLKNVVDKIITVKNTGKTSAYVRTIIAIEAPDYDPDNLIHVNVNGSGLTYTSWAPVVIDGVEYVYAVFTYNQALAPNEISAPSLMQVFLDSKTTNEDVAKFGDTWEILAVSQAVQADGWDDPSTALNDAFGTITATNNPWVEDGTTQIDIVNVKDADELTNAVTNAVAGKPTVISLADGNYTTNLKIAGGMDITIQGSEKAILSGQIASTTSTAGTITLKGVTVNVDNNIKDTTGISQTGKSAIALWGNQTVVCENVTFNMSLSDSSAISAWWDTGVGTSIIVKNCVFNCNGQRPIRATGNVTVENCTFNDPYRYAVQLTAKTSTANLMDKAIINFNNNTIVNGENGKDYVYGIQLEGETYGCQDCVINGAGNTIENGGTESTMYYCECGKVDHATIEWNTEADPVHAN